MNRNTIIKDVKKENKNNELSSGNKNRDLSSNITSSRRASKISVIEDNKKNSARISGIQIQSARKDDRLSLVNTKLMANIDLQDSISATNLPINLHQSTANVPNINSNQGNVNVVCRFRPQNEKEKNTTKDQCVEFISSQMIEIHSSTEENKYKFSFDRIFDTGCTQQEVYEFAAKPIIESVLEGFNGTIFAYGQTSSGKTFTMQGINDNPEKEGIIPRMIRNVFNSILHASSEIEFTVKVSMVEIYMEKIRDLIDPTRANLNIREDRSKGIYIEDLSECYCSNEDEVLDIMKLGNDNRAIGTTNMNEHSSRSHSIFIMTIHQNNIKDLVAKTGKLYLVDLAGSEKISKSGATGLSLEEAKTINKSLTTLGMVINNLTDGKSQHVPYRNSKLTRVLQESLGGNAKTCLIITCSPSSYNDSETLSTLRFGLRAKNIKNKPKINKEVTVAELKLEIDKLEKCLVVCHKRIGQLEDFIKSNNLSVPHESDFSFMKDDKKVVQEKKDKIIPLNEEDLKHLKNDELITNENYYLDTVNFATDAEFESNEKFEDQIDYGEIEKNEIVQEVTDKYKHYIDKVNLLEENNKDLNDKLEDAIFRVQENYDILNQKNKIIEQLEQIKYNYELKEKELNNEISDLRDKLVDKEKEIEHSIKMEDLALPVGNINVSKNELSEEIYNKIEDIVVKYNIDEANNEIVINQLNSVVDFVKSKLNIVSTPGSSNSVHRNSELEISNSTNISPNNSQITEESIRREKKKYENEKKLILKALEEKADKIVQYENDNKELKDRIKLLESKMNPDDKNYVKKIVSLEKNLEQVNLMYHQVVTQKSVLKIENQVLEKKIKKRNEKISMVDKENNDLREQLKMRDDKLTYYHKTNIKSMNAPITANVVKVIKGGHVKHNGDIQND